MEWQLWWGFCWYEHNVQQEMTDADVPHLNFFSLSLSPILRLLVSAKQCKHTRLLEWRQRRRRKHHIRGLMVYWEECCLCNAFGSLMRYREAFCARGRDLGSRKNTFVFMRAYVCVWIWKGWRIYGFPVEVFTDRLFDVNVGIESAFSEWCSQHFPRRVGISKLPFECTVQMHCECILKKKYEWQLSAQFAINGRDVPGNVLEKSCKHFRFH